MHLRKKKPLQKKGYSVYIKIEYDTQTKFLSRNKNNLNKAKILFPDSKNYFESELYNLPYGGRTYLENKNNKLIKIDKHF